MTDQPPKRPSRSTVEKLAQLSIIGTLFAGFIWVVYLLGMEHFALMRMVIGVET